MIGKTVSHFKIIRELGRGGMGVVYAARDVDLERDVALKFLSAHSNNDESAIQRFIAEARAASALDHENICAVYEVGRDTDGSVFIAMPYYSGHTLKEIIAEGPLDVEQARHIAAQIAAGLVVAHDRGIVHRDIKPANIVVTDRGQAKILDFGLAKLMADTVGLTADGTTVGTVGYMAPEQLRGERVDARSDVWSLGVVLYEMLTQRLPFKGDHPAALSYSILHEAPASLLDSRPLLSQLNDVVSRCLEKSPEQRYRSAADLYEDLTGLAATTGTRSAATRPFSLMGVLLRPYVAVPLAVGVIAAIAAGVSMNNRSQKARWARQVAIPEIERAIDETPWTGGVGFWRAFALEKEAKRYLPDDPVLLALEDRTVAPLTIRTEPAGALVYARPYADADTSWTLVGKTPIDSLRFVRGVFRVRIEKHGFQTADDLFWNECYDEEGRVYALKRPDQIPRGMLWVSGKAPRVHSTILPNSLHMPGFEHLTPPDLGDFLIDRHEVTNKAFKVFVEAGGYNDPSFWKQPFLEDGQTIEWKDAIARFTDKTQRPGPAGWEVGDYPEGTGQHPVTGVSWYEAAAFAEFAGKSLPTIYHFDRVALTWASADIVPTSNLTSEGMVPVGSTTSMNRFGAFDLAGNAREWCANATSNGDRYILGGGWNDPPYGFNDAYAQSPWDRSETNGFRCMRYVGTVDPATFEATIEVPHRDFMSEPAPSDTVFALYANLFRYDKTPLHAVVESTLEADDYVREKIVIDAAYGGERMAMYLFLPKKSSPPYQTVVLFPGSGSIHTRSSEHLSPVYSGFVVKGGRALLWPILKSTYERGDDQTTDVPDESNRYKEHVVMWGKDIMRSVDYLETRKDIDSGRLAFLGQSWGGALAPIVLTMEPRFKAAVLVVAGLMLQPSQPEADAIQYIRRVQAPVIMINGKYDFFFPYETSQLPFYQLLGTPTDHKKLVVYEFGHAVPAADRAREGLAWLDKYLGAVR